VVIDNISRYAFDCYFCTDKVLTLNDYDVVFDRNYDDIEEVVDHINKHTDKTGVKAEGRLKFGNWWHYYWQLTLSSVDGDEVIIKDRDNILGDYVPALYGTSDEQSEIISQSEQVSGTAKLLLLNSSKEYDLLLDFEPVSDDANRYNIAFKSDLELPLLTQGIELLYEPYGDEEEVVVTLKRGLCQQLKEFTDSALKRDSIIASNRKKDDINKSSYRQRVDQCTKMQSEHLRKEAEKIYKAAADIKKQDALNEAENNIWKMLLPGNNSD